MTDVLLWDRRATLTIDTIKIERLRFVFTVDASTKPQPNKASISVFNLNPDHRSQIEELRKAPVRLDVGYAGGTQTIFLGDLRTCPSVRDGADIVTTIESGDGEKAIQTSRVNKSHAKGTSQADVLRDVALSLGVLPGNLDAATKRLKSAGVGIFPAGTVLTGSAAREMTNLCKSLNLEWSIQKGALQILERGKALEASAVKLHKYSGMIGAPTVDNRGILSVSSLMNPEIFPGRLLVLDGDRLKGQYRIEDCHYAGDTHGAQWQIDVKGKRY